MDDKGRQKRLVSSGGELSGFPKNIPTNIIVSILEGKPARVSRPPVDLTQVMLAANAASIIQDVWRLYSATKRRAGRGLTLEELQGSLRKMPSLRR